MIATDLQPTSIVNDKGFQEFLKVIDPKYIPPSRRTITRDLLPKIYNTCKVELQESLVQTTSCAITTDLWTSRSTQGYMTVTCHYVDGDGNLRSSILATPCLNVDHTGANIAEELGKVTHAWNVHDKVVCAVTDSASNISVALRILKWSSLPCFAHTLNLVVQGAIAADVELSGLKTKCKSIVSYFHRSVKASDHLAKVQKQLNLPPHKLIQEVETRWNSTFYMFERYLEQHSAITTTLCLLEKRELCLDNTNVIHDAVQLLAPFEAVTTEVSTEYFASLSKVIPMVRSLQKLTITSTSKSVLRETLLANMAHRFATVEHNNILAASTFLDPRFKKLGFTQPLAATQCEKNILSEMGDVLLNTNESTDLSQAAATDSSLSDTTTSNSEQAASTSLDVWSLFDARVNEVQGTQTTQSECIVEMRQYLQANLLDRREDPIKWWSDNKALYKRLHALAKKFLSIPATSVPAERVFSKAGELISAKRNRLKETNVDTLLFLNKNY